MTSTKGLHFRLLPDKFANISRLFQRIFFSKPFSVFVEVGKFGLQACKTNRKGRVLQGLLGIFEVLL